jgi:hypothetical protein
MRHTGFTRLKGTTHNALHIFIVDLASWDSPEKYISGKNLSDKTKQNIKTDITLFRIEK